MPTPSHATEADRPTDAELLKDAAWYHLIEAATDAAEATRHLHALAKHHQHQGLTPDQFQQLDSLSDVAQHVANQARRMLAEVTS